jgi:hypothetical protein
MGATWHHVSDISQCIVFSRCVATFSWPPTIEALPRLARNDPHRLPFTASVSGALHSSWAFGRDIQCESFEDAGLTVAILPLVAPAALALPG